MISNRGNFQERYGHPDIVVQADPPYQSSAEWILGYFEEQIRQGVVFRPKETVQIGWTTVLLEKTDDDALQILEPEFGSLPVKWRLGVSSTARFLMVQKEVCDQLGVDVAYTSMRQSGVVSPDFLTKSQHEFRLNRDNPSGNDSGWVFRASDYRGLSGSLCSLYEIAIAVPAVIPYLALPPGSTVRRSKVGLEISANGSDLSSSDNDFLKRLLASASFS